MPAASRLIAGGVLSLSILGSAAYAQQPGCPSLPATLGDTTVYLPCQVDEPVRGVQVPAPAYPPMMLFQGISGRTWLRFVVDTNGRVDVGTLQVLETTHATLTAAVRNMLPRLRFQPARRVGRAVRARWEWDVRFTLPTSARAGELLGSPQMPSTDSASIGVHRTTVGFGPVEGSGPVGDRSATRRAHGRAARQVIEEVAARYPREESLVVCVGPRSVSGSAPVRTDLDSLLRSTPDSLTTWDTPSLVALMRPWTAVVDHRRCPRSFGSWIARVDSLGRRIKDPPGRDPISLGVVGSIRWNEELVIVGVIADRTYFECVIADADATPAACIAGARWMH